MEIEFLVDMIQSIADNSEPELPEEISALKSNTFEVLGQSVLEPEKAEERKKSMIRGEFHKKYNKLR